MPPRRRARLLALPAGWEQVPLWADSQPDPSPEELTLDQIENLMDPSRPTVRETCGDCGELHDYRLISDDPEDWEQLEECGS
jgi:hypothetical protein